MSRRFLLASAAATALVLSACGDDTERSRPAVAATPAPASAELYCATARRLDTAGEKFFASLGRDASPEDYTAAEKRFVEEHADLISRLRTAAPASIKHDVDLVLAGQRMRAGLGPQVDEKAAGDAEKRVLAFERRRCRT